MAKGVYMAKGDMCGEGDIAKVAYVAGGLYGRGACVAGETDTAADGTHPTGMHSFLLYDIPESLYILLVTVGSLESPNWLLLAIGQT